MANKKKSPETSKPGIKPRADIDGVSVWCSHDRIIDVAELTPNPRNPNTHPQKQIKLLSKIIRHQGWRNPITVSNRSGFIVKGHGRLQAAISAGFEKVPAEFQDYKNEAAEWQDLLADNKIAELAETDTNKLKDIMQGLKEFDANLELTGFDIFENAVEGIFQCTPDGCIISANPSLAKIMGYDSPSELISSVTNLSEQIFIDAGTYNDFRGFVDEEGRIVGYETFLYQKQGSRLWVSLSFRPVKDINENVIFYEGSFVDVTARKEKEKAERARKAAEAASKSKSEFLANMSHEIRTPMNGIIGMTELLMTTGLTEQQKDYAEAISGSANGLLTVLNDILDFSKIQAGKLTIESEQFNLRKLVGIFGACLSMRFSVLPFFQSATTVLYSI